MAFVAAITGQHCVRKLIAWLGRASLIIFILASMIFVSALTLGTYVRTASIDRSIVHALPSSVEVDHQQELQLLFENHASLLALCRRGRHLKHSPQDGAASVHGLRKPLQGLVIRDPTQNASKPKTTYTVQVVNMHMIELKERSMGSKRYANESNSAHRS